MIDGPGVLYQLNGLGPNGSIMGGKPSRARLKLVHREALELALYTFRYLPDVEMVVTLLPAAAAPRRRRRGRPDGAAARPGRRGEANQTGTRRTSPRQSAIAGREGLDDARPTAANASSTAPATSSRSCRCRSA